MRELYLCNTVYQVMVAVWIKYRYSFNQKSDIIISEHMNDGAKIASRIRENGMFESVFYAKTLIEARYNMKRSRRERILGDLNQNKLLKQYVLLSEKYTDLYFANFDGFSQLLFTAMSRKNRNLKLHIFEDGLSTYCDFEKYYLAFQNYYGTVDDVYNPLKRFLHQKVYKLRPIYGNVSDFRVFNPSLMKWNPGCPILQVDKIDRNDDVFRKSIREIFKVDACKDYYDRKYIFFEESYFADGDKINDVELVEQLVSVIGKENVMIKIHPRNPVNRFAELGYKTNVDTSIPWEVLLMEMEGLSDKVLITVASTAILNPIMIFGTKVDSYSLFPCLKIVPKRLQGDAWDFLKEMFEKFSETITICDDMSQIK